LSDKRRYRRELSLLLKKEVSREKVPAEEFSKNPEGGTGKNSVQRRDVFIKENSLCSQSPPGIGTK
jgi:hypothetical protein